MRIIYDFWEELHRWDQPHGIHWSVGEKGIKEIERLLLTVLRQVSKRNSEAKHSMKLNKMAYLPKAQNQLISIAATAALKESYFFNLYGTMSGWRKHRACNRQWQSGSKMIKMLQSGSPKSSIIKSIAGGTRQHWQSASTSPCQSDA